MIGFISTSVLLIHRHDEGSVAKGLDKKVYQLLLFCPFHFFFVFCFILLVIFGSFVAKSFSFVGVTI